MTKSGNTYFYKGISLLIKAIVLIFSFWYIWKKIIEANKTIDFNNFIHDSNKNYLVIVFVLMFYNWGLEALKWKILVAPLEPISFLKAIKSVFAGVTVSIFTPNRVGEFAGRVFILEEANKIQASLKSFIGSIAQLFVTLIIGLIALIAYYNKGFYEIHPIEIFTIKAMQVAVVFIIVVGLGLLYLYKNRVNLNKKKEKYFNIIIETKRNDLLLIIFLSFIRYFVFTFQYYLVLMLFHVPVDFETAFILIALTFLLMSAIPTFALSEIVVRGATAVYFFNVVTTDHTSIIAASFVLWVINLAVPAILGSVFVWNAKLVKDKPC
jgi:uncharacterized membrane protein YbhN (UPF0104 family)